MIRSLVTVVSVHACTRLNSIIILSKHKPRNHPYKNSQNFHAFYWSNQICKTMISHVKAMHFIKQQLNITAMTFHKNNQIQNIHTYIFITKKHN